MWPYHHFIIVEWVHEGMSGHTLFKHYTFIKSNSVSRIYWIFNNLLLKTIKITRVNILIIWKIQLVIMLKVQCLFPLSFINLTPRDNFLQFLYPSRNLCAIHRHRHEKNYTVYSLPKADLFSFDYLYYFSSFLVSAVSVYQILKSKLI